MNNILPWLLHHANRHTKMPEFYAIKDSILKEHGKEIGYEIQHIEGKKCNACGGSGIYHGIYWQSGESWTDSCNRCCNGWYKSPQWICLMKYQFGKYYFHRPLKREYCVDNPFTEETLGWKVSDSPVIQGYIDHSTTKWGSLALKVLIAIYNRPAFNELLRKEYQSLGTGWRVQWWRPSAYLNNLFHLIKHGRNSIPIKYFRIPTFLRIEIRMKQLAKYRDYFPYVGPEQLPF